MSKLTRPYWEKFMLWATPGGVVKCLICKHSLISEEVAMMLRAGSAEPFNAVCYDCAAELVQAFADKAIAAMLKSH
jgi:hypothetical protein